MKPIYPDRTLEYAAQAAKAPVLPLWQKRGPVHTQISWIEALLINGCVVMVQTYRDGGWQVFSPCQFPDVDDRIADTLTRCGVVPQVAT